MNIIRRIFYIAFLALVSYIFFHIWFEFLVAHLQPLELWEPSNVIHELAPPCFFLSYIQYFAVVVACIITITSIILWIKKFYFATFLGAVLPFLLDYSYSISDYLPAMINPCYFDQMPIISTLIVGVMPTFVLLLVVWGSGILADIYFVRPLVLRFSKIILW